AAEEIRRTARRVRRGPVRAGARAVDGRARARYLLPDLAVRGEQHRRVGALQDDGLGETVEDDEAQQVAAGLLVDLHRLQQLGPLVVAVVQREPDRFEDGAVAVGGGVVETAREAAEF